MSEARVGPVAASNDPALTSPSLKPAPQSVDNLVIDLVELPVCVASLEVVAPSSEHRVEVLDDLFNILRPVASDPCQFVDAPLDSRHRPR